MLVTRPAEQAAGTVKLLRSRGAEAVSFPTIAIGPPPDLAPAARAVVDLAKGAYDLVVFTSDNGVRCFFEVIAGAGRDARIFGNCRLAAIGPAPAAALAKRGLSADIVAERYVAESLAAAIVAQAPAARRVLLPRALVAREALPELLRGSGFSVDVVPVYATVEASRERAPELAKLLSGIDVVMLTSSSTVQNLCAVLGPSALTELSRTTLASIGPITTAAAVDLGLTVAVTAEVSTSAGLIDAIERWYSGKFTAGR